MIGVLINKEGRLTDFFHWEKIELYQEGFYTKPFSILNNTMERPSCLTEIRTCLEQTTKLLQGCRVLLGTDFLGLPYQYFDRENFILCENDTCSGEILEKIVEQLNQMEAIEKTELSTDLGKIPLTPQAVDHEGNYFLDFSKLQKYHPELTSKKVLLPFFATELFQSLEIVCNHKMPWLDSFLEQRQLELIEKREAGVCTLFISHKTCN